MKLDLTAVEEAAKTLYIRALKSLPPDIKEGMTRLQAQETDNTAKSVLRTMVTNITVAEHPLRSSVVHPLTRKNEHTSGGIGVPVIHFEFDERAEKVEIEMIPKGSGSENNSFLRMAIPAEGIDAIKRFVVDCVIAAGGKTCPPTIVGVGVGGTSDLCVHLAKRAATRPLGSACSDPDGAALEAALSKAVNLLGVGPQGLGGDATAFAVHVELAATHITMNPVAVNMQCHSARRARATFTPNGVEFGY